MSIMTSETCLVLSGKGGVGKTTILSNVATSIAMMGKKTAIIDADLALNLTTWPRQNIPTRPIMYVDRFLFGSGLDTD